VAAAQTNPSRIASEPSHTPIEDAPASVAQVPAPVESAREAALKIKNEDVPRQVSGSESAPEVSLLTEVPHVPEPVAKADSVELTSPTPVAEAPVHVELAPEVAPTLAKEPEAGADEPLGLADEVTPEPAQDVSSEPIVPEPAVEAAAEPEITPTEAAAEPIEEPHLPIEPKSEEPRNEESQEMS